MPKGIRVRKATLSLNEVCTLLRDEEHLIVALINGKGSTLTCRGPRAWLRLALRAARRG